MKPYAAAVLLVASAAQTSMNMKCIMAHCPTSFAAAMIDPAFVKEGKCQKGCEDVYKNDTTPMKLHYQNCTTKCALSYESRAGDKLTGCAMKNRCMSLPPINSTCPAPEVEPNSSLADLSGEWWQHYGKNALWDCYPCQHIHAMRLVDDAEWCAQTVGPNGAVQAPCYSYTYSYDLFTEDGSKYFTQTWQLPDVGSGKPVDIYYSYMGSTHNETWYILKSTDRYVALVDCSYMLSWTNVGSILWVRPHVKLSAAELSQISRVYKERLGWDFPGDFCYDLHGGNCTEPARMQGAERHTAQ